MLVAVFAFEGVGSGTGPWVTTTGGVALPAQGWQTAFFQAPSASGVGIQVINTLTWSSSQTTSFGFDTTRTFVGRGLVYTGQFFDGTTTPIRTTSSQQWTGNQPQTPTVTAFTDELLLAVAGQTLAAPGFGTPNPVGSTQRFDSFRTAYGDAELTAADYQVAAGGTLGPFTWP